MARKHDNEGFTPEHYKRSSKTKLKPRAMRELNNQNLIYQMGGNPVYLHSFKAYFNTGLRIAMNTITSLLNSVFNQRKQVLLSYADMVDDRWKQKLQDIFQGVIPTFEEFKKKWDAQKGKQSVFNAIASLADYKEAQTKLSAYGIKQTEVRTKYKAELTKDISTERLNQINKELAPSGLQIIGVKANNTISWGGAAAAEAAEWSKYVRNYNKKAIPIILEKAKTSAGYRALVDQNINTKKTKALNQAEKLAKAADRELSEKDIAQIIADNSQMTSISPTNIGNLFEYDSVGDYVLQLVDKAIDFKLVNVATNVKGSKQSESSTTADTKLMFGNIDIFLSDKASESVNYSDSSSWYLQPTDEQFHAAFESKTLNFARLEVPDAMSDYEYELVQNLCNYVHKNSAVFKGTRGKPNKQDIVAFKEKVVFLGAWIKISKAIIGTPSGTLAHDTPIGLRTLRSIYNIGDLLRFFGTQTKPEDIRNYLQQNTLDSGFYAFPTGFSSSQAHKLFSKKRRIIEESVQPSTSEGDATTNKQAESSITYSQFLSNPDFMELLRSLGAGISAPSISTHFVIKLRNI